MIGKSALVVLSGGQDSTTCLYWAKRNFERVASLSFRYGQKHVAEVDLAHDIAREANVEWECMDLPFIADLAKDCSLTNTSLSIEEEKPSDSLPSTFVPGRNLFFLSIAAIYACQKGIFDLVTGVSQTDFSGYPDCRDSFVKSLNVTINLATDRQFRIHTPLMWIDKAGTWKMADELGVMDIGRYKTLTCYNGIVGDGCGHCPSCKLRKKGLEQYEQQRKRIAQGTGQED